MSEPLLIKYKGLIAFLNKLSRKKRTQVITGFKREHIHCLSEIFKNFLKRKLTDNKKVIQRLKKYKEEIKRVARNKTSLKDKIKTLASKRGGNILGILLPLAVKLVTSLLSSSS